MDVVFLTFFLVCFYCAHTLWSNRHKQDAVIMFIYGLLCLAISTFVYLQR